MPAVPPLRVIKLGGSLLDWPEWPPRFRHWLSEQPPAVNILIVGGGRLVDEIRERDRTVRLDPSAAHWLAIDAMAANIAAVRRLLPEAIAIDRWEDLQKRCQEPISGTASDATLRARKSVPDTFSLPALIAFCPRDFLRRVEPHAPGPVLPHSWDVTSDSIAARLAAVLGAEELVLLKSAPPPESATLQEAADAGYIDRCFPQFAARCSPPFNSPTCGPQVFSPFLRDTARRLCRAPSGAGPSCLSDSLAVMALAFSCSSIASVNSPTPHTPRPACGRRTTVCSPIDRRPAARIRALFCRREIAQSAAEA